MKRIAVGDVMTRNFIHVSPDENLHKCAKMMAKDHVDSLLLVEGKKLIGIITSRDILWAISKNPKIELKKIQCREIATKKVAVIKPSAEISQSIAKMREYNFRRLPVLSKGEIIGVVTLKDILAIEPELYSEIRHLMDDVREEDKKKGYLEAEYPSEGICENCGAFSELLRVENQLLCPDCREDMY